MFAEVSAECIHLDTYISRIYAMLTQVRAIGSRLAAAMALQ